LAISSFPSILLLTTLFRLSLGIATTRLILLEGDAGHIVQTFGEFVVGGNLVVGLVVFLIITIVQFIVITKGSERIAEVSARFSLDAMPGKQMSIDSDMRAGLINLGRCTAPALQSGKRKPTLRRTRWCDEIRERRCNCRLDHYYGQYHRRHSHRHDAARHDNG